MEVPLDPGNKPRGDKEGGMETALLQTHHVIPVLVAGIQRGANPKRLNFD
ncbi:hypothetical protein SAMN05428936_104327 [Pelagibacterium halotolerans]|nr:hypothetical protein SAMN05428936_104327 [Pelagibacterium halotolerans]